MEESGDAGLGVDEVDVRGSDEGCEDLAIGTDGEVFDPGGVRELVDYVGGSSSIV